MVEEKENTKEVNIEEIFVVRKVKSRFGRSVIETKVFRGEVTFTVSKEILLDVCRYLKHDPDLQYNFLADVVGVDYRKTLKCFEVVYHLCSYPNKSRLRVKVKIGEDETVPSVTSIWRSANFAEREVYDMFGIVFEGHPDIKRIYMPPDWEGYPLRKDYPITGYKDEYNPFGVEKEKGTDLFLSEK